MTRIEMEQALVTGFNKQGRSMSETMRARYLAALAPVQVEPGSFEYRGFRVSGGNGKYFIDGMPHTIATSVQKSEDAIDRMLAIRAEMAEA